MTRKRVAVPTKRLMKTTNIQVQKRVLFKRSPSLFVCRLFERMCMCVCLRTEMDESDAGYSGDEGEGSDDNVVASDDDNESDEPANDAYSGLFDGYFSC